jgi:zinc finger BED domain-containing protein 1 (E3 SUMO-protein ligase ZBED1)
MIAITGVIYLRDTLHRVKDTYAHVSAQRLCPTSAQTVSSCLMSDSGSDAGNAKHDNEPVAEAPASLDTESEARKGWKTCTKSGVSSSLWNHFKVYTQGRCSHLAVCSTCEQEINRGPKKSTTPLQQHLTHNHPELDPADVVDKMEQSGSMDKFAAVSPDFPDALLKWMVHTQQALRTASEPHFKNLVYSLNKKTKVPGRAAMTKRLKEVDLQVRQSICKLVVGMFVACTTDAWTSAANEAFCSLTLHWLTEAFELVSIALDCSTFPGSHTGEAVAAKLNELLQSYGIPLDHVVAAVTDTAPNMVKAGRFMPYDWLGCMAHLLELVTGLAFNGEGVKDALKAARKLVGSIKSSSQAAADLKQLLASLNMSNLTVIQDVVTRWWSTYSMVARLLQLKASLELLHSTRKLKLKLTAAEWTILEHVQMLLKPFMYVQKALEGEQYVTISLVPFLLSQLRAKLTAVASDSPVAALAATMLEQFNQRFGDGSVESLPVKVAVAAALDPRTKQLKGIAIAEHSAVWAEVKNMVLTAHSQTASSSATTTASAAATAAPPAAASAAVDSDDYGEDLSGDMFDGLMELDVPGDVPVLQQHEAQLLRQFNLELSYFTELPALPHKDANKNAGDPLKWWQQHRKHLPLLSEVARKVLCIPATSAPSERLFSAAGLIVTDKRSRLTGGNVGRLTFLSGSWEKAAELTRAAELAGAAAALSGSGVEAGTSSSSSSWSAAVGTSGGSSSSSAPGVAAFRNSINAASVSAAEQAATLRLAAAALPEGTTASNWLSGAAGKGVGVPKAAAGGKAKKASKAKAGGITGRKALKQNKAAAKSTKSAKSSSSTQPGSGKRSTAASQPSSSSSSSSSRTRASTNFFSIQRKRTVDSDIDTDDDDDDDDDSSADSGNDSSADSGNDSSAQVLNADVSDSDDEISSSTIAIAAAAVATRTAAAR